MKNLGTLLSCMAFLVSCSTATVKTITLSNGVKGFDVNCLGDQSKCEKRAKTLCESGKIRVHNTYESNLMSLQEKTSVTMRMECLEESASLEQCSLPGVSCLL
ncbi:MAG: hypothetical protein VXV96_02365 [Bdellovibrionota bacterium]|jgi:hypothetical protein|nr:hypothetical protein [Bdellovibrionota bacterium]